MHDFKWTDSERKAARLVFDAALERELAAVLSVLKEMAWAASTPEEMWKIEEYLGRQRREIDAKYDFRYSQLIHVFGRLLRERRIEEEELLPLSPDKRACIVQIASL